MKIIYSKHIYNYFLICINVVLLLFALAPVSYAQQRSLGNTYVLEGGQLSIFGRHSFNKNANAGLSGIIGTGRSMPYGVLNFLAGSSAVGADNGAHVDGYVRKLGTSSFVFPVGDNGFYGPFAAAGNGTTGAYYHANPAIAITSKLGGGNYPVLPANGPFSLNSKDIGIDQVSATEYWDIDGTNTTNITLTWNQSSVLSDFCSKLDKLIIVGWNGEKWVKIPSLVDDISILGGASNFISGSIKTSSAIIPDEFSVYTLASLAKPFPVILVDFAARLESNTSVLNWTTTMETNSSKFNIERSQNGKSWEEIGFVLANGESSSLISYSYIDKYPLQGENLYRLKIVDIDNTFAYSRIQYVKFEKIYDSLILYPNPATDKLCISLGGSNIVKDVKDITIIDMNGNVQQDYKLTNEAIIFPEIKNGTYIISITNHSGITYNSKFVIAK